MDGIVKCEAICQFKKNTTRERNVGIGPSSLDRIVASLVFRIQSDLKLVAQYNWNNLPVQKVHRICLSSTEESNTFFVLCFLFLPFDSPASDV